jgi:hypothetical protein
MGHYIAAMEGILATGEIGFTELGSDVVPLQYHSRTSECDGGAARTPRHGQITSLDSRGPNAVSGGVVSVRFGPSG